MSVRFAGRSVGRGHPCFITYEAGPTHDGIESAKRLVELAAEAGANAVKFQFFDVDYLVADKTQPFTYDILVDRNTGETKTIEEPLYDILKRRCLEEAEWRAVKAHADQLGLAFFATVTSEEDIAFLVDLGCDSLKISSADVTHTPLLRLAARTGLCLQLDTGNASLGEVETAVDIIREEGNDNIIIHHCPSGYPARLESINLNVISTLQQLFPYPVAYSDHSPGWEMDVAAVALGANMVEKTITLDRTTPSVEHVMSLEPGEMKEFVQIIRDVETALGNSRRIMHPEERQKRQAVRRSAFAATDLAPGTVLADAPVDFRRPGTGLTSDLVETLGGLRLTRPVPQGTMIKLVDLSPGGDD